LKQNLLLSTDDNDAALKIADFGFARYFSQPLCYRNNECNVIIRVGLIWFLLFLYLSI